MMEVKLTKDSWHYRIQEYIFNDVPFQKNFCPYFWLTIFCVFCFPVVWLWVQFQKPLYFLGGKLADGIESFGGMVDTKVCAPYKHRSLSSITPEQAFLMFEAQENLWMKGWSKKDEALQAKFRLWRIFICRQKDDENAWEAIVAEGKKKVLAMRERDREIHWEEERREAERQERIKRLHYGIIKVTKVFFYGLGTLLVGAILVLIVFMAVITWEARASVVHFLVTYGPAIVGAIILIVALVGLIFLALQGVKCYEALTPPKVKPKKESGKFAANIKGFFSFFWLFFSNFKKNHCPHIEWVD